MHVYARIKPEIMRQFYIPTPYSLQGENISDGKKYCLLQPLEPGHLN